jgi:hypothetical protein
MGKRDLFAKILAIIGTVLIWIPLLLPVIFSISRLISRGRFNFDFLMPAELFFFAIAGGILLIWAAFRSKLLRKWISWSFGACLALTVIDAAAANLTGLAAGVHEPTGWRLAVVLGIYIFFLLAFISTAIGSILLIKKLFRNEEDVGR